MQGVNRWRGDEEARRAVYNNRARLRSGVAKEAFKLRAELVERSFALTLDRGGMRRAWLRGRENLHKRYLVHVAGYNLGLIMRLLVGAGTPRELMARTAGHLLVLTSADGAVIAILTLATDTETAMLAVSIEPEPHGRKPTSSTGCYSSPAPLQGNRCSGPNDVLWLPMGCPAASLPCPVFLNPLIFLVEPIGIEPTTSCVQSRRSPS